MRAHHSATTSRTSPGHMLDDMTDEELRHHLAHVSGVLAHRRGTHHAFTVLMRIAGALDNHRGRQ